MNRSNFSIFDDAGTMGFTDRVTTIQGNGTDNTLVYSSDSWFRGQIAEAMNENLIGVAGIQVTKSGGSVVFEIEVLNSTNSSGEQIRQMVQQAVANKTYAYSGFPMGAVYGRYILKNVSTRVLRDTGAAPTPGQTPPPTYFPPPNPPPTGTIQPPSSGSGGSGFVDNLGLGLGISTPMVIGAGALLLLLVLKK